MTRLATLCLLLAACADPDPGCRTVKSQSMKQVESEAADFARRMSPDHVRGVACVNRDSDSDGYVSCTVFRDDAPPLAIECLYLEGESGCKIAVPKVRVEANS